MKQKIVFILFFFTILIYSQNDVTIIGDNAVSNEDSTWQDVTVTDNLFLTNSNLKNYGLLFLDGDTVVNTEKLYWAHTGDDYLLVYNDTVTYTTSYNYYSYMMHYGSFPNNVRCHAGIPWIAYANRAVSGFTTLQDGFAVQTIPNNISNWQTGMLGVLRNYTGTPISIEHSSNKAYLSGIMGRIMNEFNNNTSGTGTYMLAGIIGSDISTGTAKSYGVISDGNCYIEGTLEVTDTLFFQGDTITDITVHNADSVSITINGNIYKLRK